MGGTRVALFTIALLASASAASALAAPAALASGSTALCKMNEVPCAGGNVVTGHIQLEAADSVLATNIGTFLCEKGAILGEALGLASPLVIHVSEFALSACKIGGVKCEESGVSLLSLVALLRTGANVGTVTIHSLAFRFECGGIECATATALSSLTATGQVGNTPAKLVANQVPQTPSSGFSSQANWTAAFTVVSPNPLFISS